MTALAQGLPETIPFVAPEQLEAARGAPFAARLGANELSFGPSPHALAAMQAALSDIWKYGQPDNGPLVSALAEHLDVPPDAITVGEGIDALLGNLVRLYVAPGERVVTSLGAYPTFNYHVTNAGGALHFVSFRDDHEDPVALAQAAQDIGAKLVYFSNPNNPMGTVHQAQVVQALLDALPADCLLILDEAYVEFAPADCVLPLAPSDRRLIRFRTFSKAYGMAGARIGYGIAHPDIARGFDKIRNHFGVGRVALVGAVAALEDRAYLDTVRTRISEGRARLAAIASENGLATIPSATNFVAFDCGKDGDYARAVLAVLAEDSVFVRMPGVAPLDRCIRVSVGLPEELDHFARALPRALAQANG